MEQQRLPSLRRPPITFAHRGASAEADDNTLAAFELALRLGATGLETDAWLSADGIVILDHDGLVRTGLKRRPVSSIDRADLPPHIPSLAELYEQCGTDFELSIDVCDERSFEHITRVAREHGAESRLWLCHADWKVLAEIRADTTARLVESTRLRHIKEGPERRAARLFEVGVDAINMHHSDWSGGLTTLFHRFDRYCLAWDAQFERVARHLVRIGTDGIYGDHVGRLIDALHAEG